MDILYSFPNSFGAGVASALTAEEAAETGDEPDHLTQWGRGLRGLCTVGNDPGRLPFFRVKDHLAGEVWAFPAPGDEVEDAPGDDQIDHQGVCQIFCVNAVLVSGVRVASGPRTGWRSD